MTDQMPVEGRTDDPAEDQTTAEPATEELAPSANEGSAVPEPSVNPDVAEQQIAEWRREDEALLGEAPETTPSAAAGQVAPPTSPDEAEVATMREEGKALLGEAPEATPVPTTQESQLS